jgi:hypothetical protein
MRIKREQTVVHHLAGVDENFTMGHVDVRWMLKRAWGTLSCKTWRVTRTVM